MNKTLSHRQQIFKISISLIILAFLFSLAGCADSGNQTEASGEMATPTEKPFPTVAAPTPTTQSTPVHLLVDAEDLAGIVVRFTHPWTGEMAETIEQIAAEFSLSNEWDIWVEVETYGGETAMLESLADDVAEDDIPGLIAAYPYQLAYFDGELFSVNLTQYFENSIWGFDADAQEDIPQVFLDQFTVDGNLVALPVAPQATVLFYNQTWGQELGFAAPPKDMDAFEAQSCDATFSNLEDYNEENDGTGGWLVNFEPDALASWIAAYGGNFTEESPLTFNDDVSQDVFGELKSIYDLGCIWIGRQTDPYFYFSNRYALMFAGTLDQIPVQMAWMATEGSVDEWTVIGFPGEDGETLLVNGPGLMLTADTPENQMAAWLFAKHLLEPEVQAEIARSGFTLPVRDLCGNSPG